jgi:uridylate kinase
LEERWSGVQSMSGSDARRFTRILLKLSGEALGGSAGAGIVPEVLDRLALEVCDLVRSGSEIALVLGGGNIFRGARLQAAGMDRITGDQLGMLATVMNALAMADALRRLDAPVVVMSAIPLSGITDPFNRNHAIAHLQQGRVVIFTAGTGNPLFTTDSAACLRAIEIGAEVVFKATKVDGVYSADPMVYPDATRFTRLTYEEVLDQRLGVMDLTAICLARDHGLPVRVFAIEEPGVLERLARGEEIGTLIEN